MVWDGAWSGMGRGLGWGVVWDGLGWGVVWEGVWAIAPCCLSARQLVEDAAKDACSQKVHCNAQEEQ